MLLKTCRVQGSSPGDAPVSTVHTQQGHHRQIIQVFRFPGFLLCDAGTETRNHAPDSRNPNPETHELMRQWARHSIRWYQ